MREEPDRLVSELASSVVHELRNMAASLKLESRSLPPDQVASRHYERLMVLSQRLSALTKPLKSRVVPFALDQALRSTLSQLEPHFRLSRIQPSVTIEEGTFEVFGDPEKGRSLLLNLIFNSLQSLPSEGGWMEIRLERLGEEFQLKISDNGLDRAEQDCNQPGPVDQAPESARIDGLNFGFFRCLRIAEDHNWMIRVETIRGQGHEVTLASRQAG